MFFKKLSSFLSNIFLDDTSKLKNIQSTLYKNNKDIQDNIEKYEKLYEEQMGLMLIEQFHNNEAIKTIQKIEERITQFKKEKSPKYNADMDELEKHKNQLIDKSLGYNRNIQEIEFLLNLFKKNINRLKSTYVDNEKLIKDINRQITIETHNFDIKKSNRKHNISGVKEIKRKLSLMEARHKAEQELAEKEEEKRDPYKFFDEKHSTFKNK